MTDFKYDQPMAMVRGGLRAVFGDRERVRVSIVVGSLIVPILLFLEDPELTVLTGLLLLGMWAYVAGWLCVFGFMFERILEAKADEMDD